MSCLLPMKGVIDRLKLPLQAIHMAQLLSEDRYDPSRRYRRPVDRPLP